MSNSIKVSRVIGKSLTFRQVGDLDYLLLKQLRKPAEEKGFLRKTNFSEKEFKEYLNTLKYDQNILYLKILDNEQKFIGTVRIQRKNLSNFEWGSWVISENSNFNYAIESALMVYKFSTEYLKLSNCKFEVINTNINVINFHKRLGARLTQYDDSKCYFEINLLEIRLLLKKYERYLDKITVE